MLRDKFRRRLVVIGYADIYVMLTNIRIGQLEHQFTLVVLEIKITAFGFIENILNHPALKIAVRVCYHYS